MINPYVLEPKLPGRRQSTSTDKSCSSKSCSSAQLVKCSSRNLRNDSVCEKVNSGTNAGVSQDSEGVHENLSRLMRKPTIRCPNKNEPAFPSVKSTVGHGASNVESASLVRSDECQDILVCPKTIGNRNRESNSGYTSYTPLPPGVSRSASAEETLFENMRNEKFAISSKKKTSNKSALSKGTKKPSKDFPELRNVKSSYSSDVHQKSSRSESSHARRPLSQRNAVIIPSPHLKRNETSFYRTQNEQFRIKYGKCTCCTV